MVEQDKPDGSTARPRLRSLSHSSALQIKQILACGAELKNTFCLTRDDHAFISQHIGDMENEETLEHFENTIGLYKRLFRIQPRLSPVICIRSTCPVNMPPGSRRTRLAAGTRPASPCPHCQLHGRERRGNPVIGVAFDGVGYGTDGAIWGGEFLMADWHGFQRMGQFEYVPMPGGAAAIKKPYRMALGYLYSLCSAKISHSRIALAELNPAETAIIKQQIQKRINCPLTSSAADSSMRWPR